MRAPWRRRWRWDRWPGSRTCRTRSSTRCRRGIWRTGRCGARFPGRGRRASTTFCSTRSAVGPGIFPNGWPAVLALGVLAGAPWSVDPLLAGLVVAIGGSLALRWGGRAGAILAAPLLALSPQAVLLGASRMSHTLCALLVLLALHALPPSGEAFGAGRGFALGAPLAALALVRPWDAVLVALVLLPVALALRPRRAAMLACGSMLALGGGAGRGAEPRAHGRSADLRPDALLRNGAAASAGQRLAIRAGLQRPRLRSRSRLLPDLGHRTATRRARQCATRP